MKKATFLGVFNPNVSKGIDANLLNDFKRGLNAFKKDFCNSRKAFLSIQRVIMSEAIRRVRKTRCALGGCVSSPRATVATEGKLRSIYTPARSRGLAPARS